MNRPLLLLALFAIGAVHAQSPAPAVTSPAKNWVLPLFSDKDGFRLMTLRGAEARTPAANRIDVTDLNITVFSGDAAARVDSMLLSPQASFFPKENRATGEKSVRFIRDDIEVTGEGWTFDRNTQKITLQKNTRVVFRAELNDILK